MYHDLYKVETLYNRAAQFRTLYAIYICTSYSFYEINLFLNLITRMWKYSNLWVLTIFHGKKYGYKCHGIDKYVAHHVWYRRQLIDVIAQQFFVFKFGLNNYINFISIIYIYNVWRFYRIVDSLSILQILYNIYENPWTIYLCI